MLVITDTRREPPVYGDLFAGKKFWVAQRMPMRNDYIARVKYNGGEVVPLEKHADYLIVDYMRKDLPPGGTSYKFIDESIKLQALQDPDDFQCGAPRGSVRDAGSAQPARHGRTPFTTDDDNELHAWVKKCEAEGRSINGNGVYKDLERRNGNHTWQSWRDRWVKTLSKKNPRTVTVNVNPPPSPPSDVQPAHPSRKSPKKTTKQPETSHPTSKLAVFTLDQFDMIFSAADSVMDVPYGRLEEAWGEFAKANPPHSGADWARYFDIFVKPIYADLLKNSARADAYDEAWNEWIEQNRATATVTNWIEHYRKTVLPSFPPPDPEIKEDPTEEEQAKDVQPEGLNNGINNEEEARTDVTPAEPGTNMARAPEEPSIPNSTATERPSTIALGKRRREDTKPDQGEDKVATPLSKRRHIDAENSFTSVQESVEVSPSKKFLESPARAPQDSLANASLSPRSSRSPTNTPPAETQQYESHPGFTVYEESQGDVGSQPSEELRIRNALEDLSDGDMFDLLEFFRAQPDGPQEQDDMTLLDILAMHTLHYLNLPESEAVLAVGDKLDELGVSEKLIEGENESDYGSESEEEQEEEEEDEREQEEEEEEQEEHEQQDEEEQVKQEEQGGQEDLWLQLAQGDADAEEKRQPSVPASYLDEYVEERPPAVKYTPQRTGKSTPSQQKQHTRPTSSSGGTVMTSFEMATEPTFDLTTAAEAETYVRSRLAPPYNFPEEHILIALHATCSNSTATADAVLRWMRVNTANKSKKGRRSSVGLAMLPDEPGVWTEDDDRALRGGHPLERKQLERKHGRLRCRRRGEFLAAIDS
ncbi:hypothetical protein SLS55_002781 [Diplodia seriata]|uniref:DNA-binding protein RAP1 n=1 Tax=Diplodia seriata TaxID=420778 RepID=A0ABR3CNV2_9PEZI